jgi:16S rRNA (adenine1518-N6/adenine1519-N6)-dimethyltransferase
VKNSGNDLLPSALNARAILRRYGIRPNPRLGQNFLINSGALAKVIAAAGFAGDEIVLEVGAGLGALTRRLAREVRQVIAVEFDRRLIPVLKQMVEDLGNVQLIAGDILSLDLEKLISEQPYRVVANIPYNITSVLIRRLMESPRPAERVVLTVQREVAERIIAKPGAMNLLAISVQLYGEPDVVARIPARAFYPKPKVDSAVLRVDVHPEPKVSRVLIPQLFRLARAGFGQKRKQLRNALAGRLNVASAQIEVWLEEAAIRPQSRAQELSLEEWACLAQVVVASEGHSKD